MGESLNLAAIRHGVVDINAMPAAPDLSVRTAAQSARLVLRGSPQMFANAGITMPATLRAGRFGAHDLLWLGPDEFLLIAPEEDSARIAGELAGKLDGQPHSIVDVSHRQVGFSLEGAPAALMLSAGCPLDLRLPQFPVGMVVRTIFPKAEIVLWRQDENWFHVEIWRSFAPYFLGHLKEAAIGAAGL